MIRMTQTLARRIERERRTKVPWPSKEMVKMVESGAGQEALDNLIFFTPPSRFSARAAEVRQALERRFSAVDQATQARFLRFLAELTISLHSFLPRWNLQAQEQHGETALSDAQVFAEAQVSRALLDKLVGHGPQAAAALCRTWREETIGRLKAEGVKDEAQITSLADQMTASVGAFVDAVCAEIAQSQLRRIAEMRYRGETITELGNDYAAFLPYAMYVGASFVTSNPVLVDIAWASDPAYWTPIVDEIIRQNPQADEAQLARAVTLEVVLANMRRLRPIFLLTTGRMGYVSLQVNPKKHDDAATMIADATAIYDELERKLDGGVPNVVFKLPATRAGLDACRTLTNQGIGVNITVNFGLFQEMRFAEVIRQGNALVSYLTEMNGRLAFPVRDELLGKQDRLASLGIDEAKAREAAAWSGVAIHKRLVKLLLAQRYDLTRVRPLVASLRVYTGAGYEGLPSAIPDITEDVGTAVITVFPNVRRAFDTTPDAPLEPYRIQAPVPEEAMQVLAHSEIFKQGYWLPDDDDAFKPDYVLTLEDTEAVFRWPPVYNTITEFAKAYDQFVTRIMERKAHVVSTVPA